MSTQSAPPILFVYLGRHGALGRFTYELATAARDSDGADCRFLISAHNENAAAMAAQFPGILTLPTFKRPSPSAIVLGYGTARRQLIAILESMQPCAVVSLMPHIWSPLLSDTIKRRGCRLLSIIHDAAPHPGDPTARVTRWLLRDAAKADRAIVLSRAVSRSLAAGNFAPPDRIRTLFHPDLMFASDGRERARQPGRPLRLLFFGRIMAYKGLDLLAEAVATLKQQDANFPVSLGVFGSGAITPRTRALLEVLGATIENRWIRDDEITPILSNYDAMICSHVEASQSGVAATAFGHRMPVIAFPTGGIVEQIAHRKTGLLARETSAAALATAIETLANEPGLYEAISHNLTATAPQRSMATFLEQISAIALAPL